tara:strand:+ start:191 stop:571 length:381 start_codon:yes stop_codon:yes gene_type:complete
MDCSTVAEEVLRRAGTPPPATSPFRFKGSRGSLGEFEEYLGEQEEAWERIGGSPLDATKIGDLVLVAEGKASRGLFVLVAPQTGTFLTSLRRTGVISVSRSTVLRSASRVLGVYRLRMVHELEADE